MNEINGHWVLGALQLRVHKTTIDVFDKINFAIMVCKRDVFFYCISF